MKKILISTDISEMAEKVVLDGVALAKGLDAEYSVISIVDDTIISPDMANFAVPQLLESQREAVRSTVSGIIERNNLKPANVFLESGYPIDTLMEKIAEYNPDILVVGTHGRKGLDHLLLGSMAEKIIRNSPVSVFVVKFKDQINILI